MVQIDNILVSEEIFEKKFVCDLGACKGECCVAGDSGAPVTEEEADILDEVYHEVKPFLRPEGIKAIEEQGTFVVDFDRELVTPLVDGKECAYTLFDEKGIAKCGIEVAYRAGATKFKKPISCELYPIREFKVGNFTAINFNHWSVCSPALSCGAKLDVKVFKFLKAPLERRFGEEFFQKLEIFDKQYAKK